MSAFHSPVMLKQSIDGLSIQPNGIYVDATFGGGGHSGEILHRLEGGRLLAFDQDEEAMKNAFHDDRLIFVRHNFRYLKNFLRYYGVEKVDGILADLGVSSHDFDEAQRGFSFRFDAPLDMRMNRESEITAAVVVNQYTENQLIDIFRNFGEIQNASRLARTIIEARVQQEIVTTGQFLSVIDKCIPRNIEKKYMAQVFQALRMTVNNEMTVLEEFLTASLETLKVHGRLVIIAYHSLEDRLVKNFMRSGNFEGKQEKDFYGNILSPFHLINRKVLIPEEDELRANPRSRSAKLRIAEKKEIIWP
jgi:16S rRNA (cytosine1402-N4)-methyltransferase